MEKRSNNSKTSKGKSQTKPQAKAPSQSQKSSTEFAKEICPKK